MKLAIVNLTLLMAAMGSSAFSQGVVQRPLIAESVPDHLIYIYQSEASAPSGAGQQLRAETRRWPAGYVLKVCFFGGNPVVHALIARTAAEWNTNSGVKLDFGPNSVWRNCMDPAQGFSQIRIAFGSKGYWSAIGADSNNLLNASQPSMNFEAFDLKYSPHQYAGGKKLTPANVVALADSYDRGTILHEFGHALSLLHEHQNPALKCRDEIRWTEPPTVYDYYAKPPNGWGREKVDFNVGSVALSAPDYNAGMPDPDSIMMYAQPAEIFKNGEASRCFVNPKNVLSQLDKTYIRQIYPPATATFSETQLDMHSLPAVSAAVANSPSGVNDLLARVRSDLGSNEASVRREARRQLASLLQSSQSPTLAARIATESVSSSYRNQLGVASALSHSSLPFGDSPEAKARTIDALESMIKRNQQSGDDPVLGANLMQAVEAVKED